MIDNPTQILRGLTQIKLYAGTPNLLVLGFNTPIFLIVSAISRKPKIYIYIDLVGSSETTRLTLFS